MAVNTIVRQARTRVRAEREAVDAKADAVEAFADRIADLTATPPSPPPLAATVTAGTPRSRQSDDRCRAVRQAFADTIRPHSVADVADDEPLLETVRAELSDSIAVALAPTTDRSFSPGLKRAIVSATSDRRTELATLARALERERTALDDAQATVETVTDWLLDADETPLTGLGFDALRTRHETLATHRNRCTDLTDRRQAFLRAATERSTGTRISHRSLGHYLYEDFPVDHPVLATATRLDSVCVSCQRAVRDHLVRRA
ncbi:DUF7260 family protein [Haloplanus natans]|uniref:DUF7260 family protein n=1 Tax=Haloplanus natans TaxID=376171 RepID=UPI000A071F4F|nr:hypothetical protein [Haloplanus natans]